MSIEQNLSMKAGYSIGLSMFQTNLFNKKLKVDLGDKKVPNFFVTLKKGKVLDVRKEQVQSHGLNK